MRFQRPGWCAAAATTNALRCFGVKVRQDVVARHAGATATDGANHHGVMSALTHFGYRSTELSERRYANALGQLLGHLRAGGSAVVLVEGGEHWVTAIGVLGRDRVIIFDPQNSSSNRAEAGVHVLGGAALRRFWDACEGVRYAILVHPGE